MDREFLLQEVSLSLEELGFLGNYFSHYLENNDSLEINGITDQIYEELSKLRKTIKLLREGRG